MIIENIIKIALGLAGLGIVVFFHELGHFLAARLTKIDVEAFSIGWGNPILKKKIGTVEYRLGMFPVGGYCKMKGDNDYNKIWEDRKNGIPPEKGSFYAATPIARIIVSFAGPFFNFVFACILLSVLWGAGFEIQTLGNKIILASDMSSGETYPADIAGFKTGDKIIEIDGQKVSYYHEIYETIATNPNKLLPVKVERDGVIHSLEVTPVLEKSTGAGRIGVSFWTDPVIGSVKEGSAASIAGFKTGDVISSANGIELQNTYDLFKIIAEEPDELILEYYRDGVPGRIVFSGDDLKEGIGLSWQFINYRSPPLPIHKAVAKGLQESYKTITVSIKSLRLLFMGIDLTNAVSGPVRITYMMGEMAAQSFAHGIGAGLRSIAEFIALISIALGIMNLLPLPIIDGGMIVLYLVEIIRRKPANPKAVSIFQTCGIVLIVCLFIFALFGDIMFFIRG